MVRIPHPHIPHLTLQQVKVLRLYFLLGLMSVLVLYAVFTSSRFQESMRRRSERVLTRATGRPVKIGSFDLSLVPPAFVIRDVWIANDPRGLPGSAFSASEIELRGIPVVSGGRVDLPKLRIVGARLVLEVFADGTSNFSTLFDKLPKSEGGGIDVRLREAVIQKGTYRFRDWRGKLDVIAQDSALVARSEFLSNVTRATFLCRSVRFKLDDGEVLDLSLRSDAVLSPGRVHLDRLTLKGKEISIAATGGIENLREPVITLMAQTNFRTEVLRKHFGVDLPLDGAVKGRATVRVPSGGRFDVRGSFDVLAARFGPFPMSGSGLIRVDEKGLLIGLPKVNYGGGSIEASVHLPRWDHPPIPVQITAKGRNIDVERFFADIDLPGTGLMGRADLETTLTFGPGGIAHADGVGTLAIRPDPGHPSAVRGRHAIPVSGGGPLVVRDGKIVFDGTPLTTAGGVSMKVDGTLALDEWVPDFRLEIEASDLREVERLADNLYPAIQKTPLTPPLLLGGKGRMTGRFSRSFSDPLVTGHLRSSSFVMRAVPFGEAEVEFTVDRNVLTLAPFTAKDETGTLVATGNLGWGGKLGDHYRLDELLLDVDRFPLEKILKFLSFDIPMTGPLTGKVPLSGVTPAIFGGGDVVWTNARAWDQPFDRVEGHLAFEGDRLRLSGVSGTLGKGLAKGDGWYAYDGAYEFDLKTEEFPVDKVTALAAALPGVSAAAGGRLSGRGTLDRPGLSASFHLEKATYQGKPIGKESTNAIEMTLQDGVLDGTALIPGVGGLKVHGKEGKSRARIEVTALDVVAGLAGLPDEAGLSGTISADVEIETDQGGGFRSVRGRIDKGDLVLFGKKLEALGGTVTWENGELKLSGFGVRDQGASTVPARNHVTLNGAISTAQQTIDLGIEGTMDASVLAPYLPDGDLAGPIVMNLKVTGTSDAPVVSGRAFLNGIDFSPADGGTPVEAITGALVFTPGKVATSGLTLRYGGLVEVAGAVGLKGLELNGIRVNARVDRMRSQPFPGFRSTVGGDLVFLGDTTLRSVRGDLTLQSGLYNQDLNLGLSTILGKLGGTGAMLAPAPSKLDAVALDIRIEAPPPAIEIRNNVARVRAGGALGIRGTWGRPLLFGQIEAEDGGRLTLRGLKYDLLAGKILFSNSQRIDPYFELSARTDVKDYRVTVALSGTMSRIAPRFSSDPPLSEAQIVSLITTGEVPTSGTSGAQISTPVSTEESIARATRELLAGLATDAAASRTKELLKLDRLQIDPIFIGSTFDAPRLTVGKNLSPELSVTYSYKASATQEQVIQVEYQVAKNAFLQFVRDENGIYSLDLRVRQRLR